MMWSITRSFRVSLAWAAAAFVAAPAVALAHGPGPHGLGRAEAICDDGEAPPALAIRACERAINSDALNTAALAHAFDRLGLARERMGGQDETAIDDFTQAVHLDPSLAEAWFHRGDLHRALGEDMAQGVSRDGGPPPAPDAAAAKVQFDAAVADFKEATARSPGYARAFALLGKALDDEGNGADALAAYKQATSLDRKLAIAFYFWGLHLHAAGDDDGAIGQYTLAIATGAEPSNERFWWDRCISYEAKGRLDEALRDCDRAVFLRDRAELYQTRGRIHLRRGEYALAIRDYASALQRDPKLEEARYGRGLAHYRLGQPEEGQAEMADAASRQADVADRFPGLIPSQP